MSRSRNIKPGFFKNELLAELPFEFRLLFIALWTYADKAGRFEYRPRRIKADLFPYDNLDVQAGLSALEGAGFIVSYETENGTFVQIINWLRHQNPHYKESESKIAPCLTQPCVNVETSSDDGWPDESAPCHADSLIPDSLIPDSLQEQDAPPAAPAKDGSRGTRLPEGWKLPTTWRAWAEAERPELPVDSEAAKFADYWHAKPGKDGRKADWLATWRNWVRNARATARAGPQQPGKTMQGIMALEGMKHGLGNSGSGDGDSETPLLGLGGPARR